MMKRVLLKRLVIIILMACLLSTSALAEEISAETWLSVLTAFVEDTGCRCAYTDGELNASRWLTDRFEAAGYHQSDRSLIVQWVPTDFDYETAYGWSQGAYNLIAVKEALHENPRILIVCAHYDSYYNTVGAKDNGSGIAALLLLAERCAKRDAAPDTEIRFIALSGEELGSFGAYDYVYGLSDKDQQSIIGVMNIDLITLDENSQNIALCCNTLGGRTEEGYQQGENSAPMSNRISRAFEKALFEVGGCTESERGISFCVPRHWGDGDHIPFSAFNIDAAAICFQGNLAEGGSWPKDMHTADDTLKPFDLPRTEQALRVLEHMLIGLSMDQNYGQ